MWILYPGGDFRFAGVPGSSVQPGSQAVSSPEGLPEKLQGVLARFRLLRLSGTRAVASEGQTRTMIPCDRRYDGCLGMEASPDFSHSHR